MQATADVLAARPAVTVETRFRYGLLVASVLSGIALFAYAGTMLWAENELSPPESVVAAQSLMLAHEGSLYYALNTYPYTVCAYMPIFYYLEAGLVRTGLPAFTAARVISFAALIGIILLCGRLAMLYTENRYAAWCARLFAASSSLLLYWGTIGQVDTLACFLSLMAFYQYSRYEVEGKSTLLAAGVFAALAIFTKQTAIAAPVSISLLLLLRNWKKGIAFGVIWALAVAALVFAINSALDGRFLANTVFANLNPMSMTKMLSHLRYFGGIGGGLLVVVAAGLTAPTRSRARAPLVYLAVALAIFLGTAAKIGSDTNYQIETTVLLTICAAIALHQVDFFRAYFRGSKTWVTLLLLPAAVHLAVGYRVAVGTVMLRIGIEQLHRAEIAELRPHVEPTGGLVLATDFNTAVRLRQRLDVEPLIYSILVSAGRIDPEPVRRDLERGAFSTVLIRGDLSEMTRPADPELTSLPASQVEAIRKRYRQVAHVGGDAGGTYVYKPIPPGAAQ